MIVHAGDVDNRDDITQDQEDCIDEEHIEPFRFGPYVSLYCEGDAFAQIGKSEKVKLISHFLLFLVQTAIANEIHCILEYAECYQVQQGQEPIED